MSRILATLTAVILTPPAALCAAPGGRNASREPAPELHIELEQASAMRLVYLEHSGPYWTAGAKFARVREYMTEQDETGPMFMLYRRAKPPDDAQTRSVSLIGFVSDRPDRATPPFRTRTLKPRSVLSMTLQNGALSPPAALQRIDEWAGEHGHQVSGEVLEVYRTASAAGTRNRSTEIQVPLLDPEHDEETTAEAIEPDSPPTPVARTRATLAERPPPPAPRPTVLPGEEPKRAAGPPPNRKAIPELMRAARFDLVATLVLPDVGMFDFAEQLWIGQVIFRVKAAGRGLDRKYPGTDGHVTALADALLERYREVFRSRPANPLGISASMPSLTNSPAEQERNHLLRELDALLARVSFAAAPDTIADEITVILSESRRITEEG